MDEMQVPESSPPTTPPPPGDAGRGKRFRRNVVAVGAALGLTLGGLGIAAAQTGGGDSTNTTAPSDRPHGRRGPGPGFAVAAQTIGISEADLLAALRSGQSVAQVAQSKGVDPQKVIDALVNQAKTRIAAKVSSGDLTQTQADQKLANLDQRVTDMVNHQGLPPRMHHGPGPRLTVAAQTIGISEADLLAALRSGQSVAQVAQSKGVDPQKVIDALVNQAKTRIAAKVSSGDLTQAQADQKLASLEQRVTEKVNHAGLPGRPDGADGPGGPDHDGPGPPPDGPA